MERTQRWAVRCAARHDELSDSYEDDGPALFGIVQGSVYEPLRRRSARDLVALDLPGYALGGLGVGEPTDRMLGMIETCVPELPAMRPRYLMGVGLPSDLAQGVARGIDMFDCVIPTRNARNGTLFTSKGRLRIKNAIHAEDLSPIDPDCTCKTCRQYHRAYLRHLFQTNELLGLHLATYHNVFFYLQLMRTMRQAIIEGRFRLWQEEFLSTCGDA